VLGSPHEEVCFRSRRHEVVLVPAIARALLCAGVGLVMLWMGWPWSAAGPVLLALAAVVTLLAAWRWERTQVVVTTEKLFVVRGTLRRRAAAVRLSKVGCVEIEQGVLGRLLGYGTIVAGELEIPYVPQPREVHGLVARLGS
jgi:membrane protein YdbS with pleckstrin-like domain